MYGSLTQFFGSFEITKPGSEILKFYTQKTVADLKVAHEAHLQEMRNYAHKEFASELQKLMDEKALEIRKGCGLSNANYDLLRHLMKLKPLKDQERKLSSN